MRLDLYLVEKNLIESRSKAQDYIKRGLVLVDNNVITKPKYEVSNDNLIKIIENNHFVSRAGTKLFNFLIANNINLKDNIILDVGSSTGGFTDCALSLGASKVYAVDVGSNQLANSLRVDKRVELYENTNILDFEIPKVDLILIDVSFTSIKPIINCLKGNNNKIIALIKPQFELGKSHKGVIKDKKVVNKILNDLKDYFLSLNFEILKTEISTLKGKDGNEEYFFYLKG